MIVLTLNMKYQLLIVCLSICLSGIAQQQDTKTMEDNAKNYLKKR